MAVGQETEVADALETGWQGVQQEAAEELFGGQGQDFGLVWMAVVFPLKRDLILLKCQQALIGDGHAVGVAAEILEHLLWAAEGRLGVNYPFDFSQRGQIAGQGSRMA